LLCELAHTDFEENANGQDTKGLPELERAIDENRANSEADRYPRLLRTAGLRRCLPKGLHVR
jgi:hypothetical protein